MSRLRTIRLVATFDLYESIRSRKAIALFLLYVIVALGLSALFIYAMNSIFAEVHEELGEGGVQEIMQSDRLTDSVAQRMFDGDKELARSLLNTPLLALFYLGIATTLMPLVIVFTSADAIASKVSTGSIRYVLFRVDRIDWVLGKLAGQTLLMATGILLGAVATFLLGVAMFEYIEVAKTAWWLLIMTGRACFYGFAYLGVALFASQLVRGPWAARGLAFLLLFLLWLGGTIVSAEFMMKQSPDFFTALHKIFPNGHNGNLFRPDFAKRGPAMLGLLAIGFAWFGLGMLRFRGRDA